MPRVRRSPATRQKKKKILKIAKGAFGKRGNVFRRAKETVQRALVYAYRDRRNKKRMFRSLWTVRLNAALRPYGFSYSKFIGQLKKANIALNRKMLSELAINDPQIFAKLVKTVN
ncbi:MAG: 50S ribosomal protein L20 [Candidatus Omnitrophota bacterium]|nr:MAG: 50S ribosomal protein L20 [Candidatus Omnitrophota bacterium]